MSVTQKYSKSIQGLCIPFENMFSLPDQVAAITSQLLTEESDSRVLVPTGDDPQIPEVFLKSDLNEEAARLVGTVSEGVNEWNDAIDALIDMTEEFEMADVEVVQVSRKVVLDMKDLELCLKI